MKNNLKQMFLLMEYTESQINDIIKEQETQSEEKEDFPFRINRVGGDKIRIQDSLTGDKIDLPLPIMDEFFEKLMEFKKF